MAGELAAAALGGIIGIGGTLAALFMAEGFRASASARDQAERTRLEQRDLTLKLFS
jgi:hypothetical protein